MYRTVIVGTDGSASADLAVREAAELTSAIGAQLIIVSAFTESGDAPGADDVGGLWQKGRPNIGGEQVPPDLLWAVTTAATAEERARNAQAIAEQAGLEEVRVRVDRGDPAEVIVAAAEDVGADLIVLGSRGMTGAKRFLLGSVPNKVSHHSPCDLIIVNTVGDPG